MDISITQADEVSESIQLVVLWKAKRSNAAIMHVEKFLWENDGRP